MKASTQMSYSPVALPSLRKAARMLRVSPSTLSRRRLPCEKVGAQMRLRPTVVLAEAAYHGKRPLDEVGHDLIEFAKREQPDDAAAIEAEVMAFFDTYEPTPVDPGSWLQDAKKFLSPDLYEQVRRAVGPRPAARQPKQDQDDTEERELVYSTSAR